MERYAARLSLSPDWLKELGLSTIENPFAEGKQAVAIRYHRRNGAYFRHRIRQTFENLNPARSRSRWDVRPENLGAQLYGVERLPDPGSQVIFVWDEAFCHVLWHHGFHAVATQGERGFDEGRDGPMLRGYDIVVFGATTLLCKRLLQSDHRRRIKIATLREHADLIALHLQAPARFKDVVRSAIAEAVPLVDATSCETPGGQPRTSENPAQADLLIGLARESAKFFASGDGRTWADIWRGRQRETWPLTSDGFRQWLVHAYYKQTGRAPAKEALTQALGTLDAAARYEGEVQEVHIRRAAFRGRYYLDLADERWRAVEIDIDGWRIVEEPPVRFERTKGMLPLPEPVPGGSIDELRPLLNTARESDFVLVVSWLVGALRPMGPYPVLAIVGDPGATKSTTARVLRALIDPNRAGLRSVPREERDLWIQARKSATLAFDNLSALPAWLSDALCRIASGGTHSVRQLQTDSDEVLFTAQLPTLLTSIGELISRSDLASRSIVIELPAIAEEARRSEEQYEAAFQDARPRILGALLDTMVTGLRNRDSVTLPRLPRMADFAIWATACESEFTVPGGFIAAFRENMQATSRFILENDVVCVTLQKFIQARTEGGCGALVWDGPGEALLVELQRHAHTAVFQAGWPRNAQALSQKLGMVSRDFEQIGITIIRGRTGEGRYIKILNRSAASR